MRVYNSEKQLRCCEFKSLDRRIGVIVTKYDDGSFAVDFCRPSVNTASFGVNTGSAQETLKEALDQTKAIIDHIDIVIAELQEHRERLSNEIILINQNGIALFQTQENKSQTVSPICACSPELHNAIDEKGICVSCEKPRFDKRIIEVVAGKLELAQSYVEFLLSVGNKEAIKAYNAADSLSAATPDG